MQAQHELYVVKDSNLSSRLEQANGNTERLESQLKKSRDRLKASMTELDKFRERDVEQINLLRKLEENCRCLEMERISERTEWRTRVEEAERKAAGCGREVELLTKSVRLLKTQLHQTQELLTDKVREHHKQMEDCKPLNPKEVSLL